MSSEILLWLDRFCQHCLIMKGQSKYTIAGYRNAIRSFAKQTESSRLSDITLSRVERWIMDGTCQRGWAPVTSRGYIKYMIAFSKWLAKQGELEANPLVNIDIPRVPKRIPKSLNRDDAENLLRFTRNYRFATEFEGARAYAMLAVFIYTGLRKRELRDLEMRDVDLGRGLVSVRHGKGGKDRMVAVPPQLEPALKGYLRFRRQAKYDHLPYFFVGESGRGRVSNKCLARLVTKLRQKSGIYFYPHMLRHTYATLMLEGGCDLFSLSKLLGHADIKTTTVYLSTSITHLQKQVLRHPVCV